MSVQMPIPDDWDGESYCRWTVCWPNSTLWLAILDGLLSQPARGRFWDASTGNIRNTQASFEEAYVANFELREVIMACGDTGLTEGLTAIANAILATGGSGASGGSGGSSICCEQTIINQGGGFQGTVTQPSTEETTPIFGTVPPIGVTPGEYPTGYDSLEEYQTDKCQVSSLVVTGMIQSLRGLASLSIVNFAAVAGLVAVAIAGIIVFPPVLIPIACMAMGVMATEATILAVVATSIEDDRENWVCSVYNSDSAQTAMGVIADLIDVIIAGLSVSGPVGLAIKTIAMLLVNADTLNQLFEQTAHLLYADADCSGCAECGQSWVWQTSDDPLGWESGGEFSCTLTSPETIDPPSLAILANVSASPGGFDWLVADFDNPMEITETSTLTSKTYVSSSTTFYQYIRLAGSEATKRYLSGSGTAIGLTELDNDLTPWVGETIVEIGFESAWSATGDHLLTFYNVEWGC